MSLRPIGTEFWSEPFASQTSTMQVLRRFLYRVVAYQNTIGGRMVEELRPLRSQTQECIGAEWHGDKAGHYVRMYDGIWKDEEVR